MRVGLPIGDGSNTLSLVGRNQKPMARLNRQMRIHTALRLPLEAQREYPPRDTPRRPPSVYEGSSSLHAGSAPSLVDPLSQ